mmetsp:Transcript_2464/g.5917  ORF Transcript_2464/g.5917 Transcript_2464/m.5917 type:complete len:222 (-) Transcript_2464:112-777(-)
MMQHQTFSMPNNMPSNGAACANNSSRLRKRKLSFPASFDNDDKMIAQKKSKQAEHLFEDIPIFDSDFSMHLDLPEVPQADKEDVFDWMENILGDKVIETSSTESDIDPSLTSTESDPCYKEMISLLAEDENDGNGEENVFKTIQESFISDRLIGHNFLPTADYSKKSTLKRSPSFNTRLGRSSRIGIRQGLTKLAKANSRSAKTRRMLLDCKFSLHLNNSQ